jgi:hypothetical protein
MFEQTNVHPLEHWALAILTPKSDGAIVSWSLRGNVAGPIEILLAIGADPFSAKYDAWVLQTVLYEIPLSLTKRLADGGRYRIQNNVRFENDDRQVIKISCNPLYSLFNHCCRPSVLLDGEGYSTASLKARDAITAGDEVFVSYLGLKRKRHGGTELTKEERSKALSQWFGGKPCECGLCLEQGEGEAGQGLLKAEAYSCSNSVGSTNSVGTSWIGGIERFPNQ